MVVTSTWRNSYFNIAIGSSTTSAKHSKHLVGKAIDVLPAGTMQNKASAHIHDATWDTLLNLKNNNSALSVVFLEGKDNKDKIFRSSVKSTNNYWKPIDKDSTNFSESYSNKTWGTKNYKLEDYGIPFPFPQDYIKPALGNVLSDHYHVYKY